MIQIIVHIIFFLFTKMSSQTVVQMVVQPAREGFVNSVVNSPMIRI